MLTEEQKKKIRENHQDSLDRPFETFELNSKVYHAVGLMNAWIRGYTICLEAAYGDRVLDWLNC